MPSPVGHSLLGLAIGAAWLLPRGPAREIAGAAWRARWLLFGCVALANAPDLDYLPGVLAGDLNAFHHFFTHTAGWCALVAAGTWCAMRSLRPAAPAALAWIYAILLSHLAADHLTADYRPPIGIMALWPLDDGFHIAPVTIFMDLKKAAYSDFLQPHNFKAVLVEAAWGLPALAAAVWLKMRRRIAGAGLQVPGS